MSSEFRVMRSAMRWMPVVIASVSIAVGVLIGRATHSVIAGVASVVALAVIMWLWGYGFVVLGLLASTRLWRRVHGHR
jgi:hypothetical protein